jgi:hypothetical protein
MRDFARSSLNSTQICCCVDCNPSQPFVRIAYSVIASNVPKKKLKMAPLDPRYKAQT